MTESTPLTRSMEAFGSLRAEDDGLAPSYFVPPSEFSRIAGNSSVIVFGEEGSGKTALFKALQTLSQDETGEPTQILVNWRPIYAAGLDMLSVSKRLTQQLQDSCALALINTISKYPLRFESAPAWAQERICWYVQKALMGTMQNRLTPLVDKASPEGKTVIQTIQNTATEGLFSETSPDDLFIELLSGLERMGFSRILVICDGLESWAETNPDQLTRNLAAFLSTLSLFEKEGLRFKFFLPDHLEPAVMRAGGVARRRLDGFKLKWGKAELTEIINKRLAFVFGSSNFSIQNLCSAPDLASWLERVGGNAPREWLDQVKPLVEFYVGNDLKEPISHETWKEIRKDYPPHFWMSEQSRKVKVGGREVSLEDIPPKAYDILWYMYQKNGEVLGKDDLYYKIYLGLNEIPRAGDKNYQSPNEYSGVIDTSIYRLRQVIEPDPAEPVIIQTVRGHGIKLVSRW